MYQMDGKLRGPEEFGNSMADWHVNFVDRDHKPYANYVCVQFGSVNVGRSEAERVAAGILHGLNTFAGREIIAKLADKDGETQFAREVRAGSWDHRSDVASAIAGTFKGR